LERHVDEVRRARHAHARDAGVGERALSVGQVLRGEFGHASVRDARPLEMHVRIPETGEYVSPLDIDDPRALGSWGPAAVQHLDDAILLDREAGPGPDSRRDRIDEAR